MRGALHPNVCSHLVERFGSPESSRSECREQLGAMTVLEASGDAFVVQRVDASGVHHLYFVNVASGEAEVVELAAHGTADDGWRQDWVGEGGLAPLKAVVAKFGTAAEAGNAACVQYSMLGAVNGLLHYAEAGGMQYNVKTTKP